MSVCVVTATIGKTDTLKLPTAIGCADYLCLSDRGAAASGWRCLPVDPGSNPTLTARRCKIQRFGMPDGFEFHVWMDAAYRLDVDPAVLVDAMGDADVAVLPHPDRSSIEEEAQANANAGHAPVSVFVEQVERYRAEGFPQTHLSTTGLMVRRNTDTVKRLGDIWWRELTRHGHTRDQMSFDYAAWKAGARVVHLEGHYRNNNYAKWFPESCATT